MTLSSLIALGANLDSRFGRPTQTLQAAIPALSARAVQIRAVSRFFCTPCFPAGSGPNYVNAALEVVWHGTPQELLQVLHRIEAEFGRKRQERWGARVIDLDLISMGGHVLPDESTYERWRQLPATQQTCTTPETLILPHPRLQDRGFVLTPLADIVPQWTHPVLGQTILQMLDALPAAERAPIIPL